MGGVSSFFFSVIKKFLGFFFTTREGERDIRNTTHTQQQHTTHNKPHIKQRIFKGTQQLREHFWETPTASLFFLFLLSSPSTNMLYHHTACSMLPVSIMLSFLLGKGPKRARGTSFFVLGITISIGKHIPLTNGKGAIQMGKCEIALHPEIHCHFTLPYHTLVTSFFRV